MSDIKITILDNGLRVITDHVPSVDTAAIGIWVGVGTRNENLSHNGAAHMVEHMLFKGTKTRSAPQIAEVIENVGGSMNAYTSRELTSYHIHLLKEDTALGLEVLADMYQNSVMPKEEVERERHVILQEIGMCHDTPDDLVFDNYYEVAYPDQAFGAPILGRADIIQNMERETLMNYVSEFYSPENTVISAAGNVDHDEFVAKAHEVFLAFPAQNAARRKAANYKGGEDRLQKDLEQSHVVIGFQGISRLDEDYYTAQALSTILGGGMSSRLFQEVREKRGLVYSVFSYHSGYADDGQFGIYAGTGPNDLPELIPVVCDEVLKITREVNEQEIERAKAQLRSNMLMGRESMMSRADQQAKHLIFRDKVLDVQAMVQKIDAIDVQKILNVAQKIFRGKPTVAALGPLSKMESYEKISERLAA